MQNAGADTEAGGFCRHEFQSFSEFFAAPLIEKHVRERYALADPAILDDGLTFCEIVDTWRARLLGAYECLVPYEPSATVLGQRGPYSGRHARVWVAAKGVPLSAYKPSETPYLVTIDRSPAQNFWVKAGAVHLEWPGFPLVQLFRMPPRGHDLHQMVEHAIGGLKNHVYKVLRKAHARGEQLTTKLVQNAAKEGSRLFTAESWSRNLVRLKECVRIVAAGRGEAVPIECVNSEGKVTARKVVMGTGGAYCYVRKS